MTKDDYIKELETTLQQCWEYLSDNEHTGVFGLGLMCVIEDILEKGKNVTKKKSSSVLGSEEEQLDMFGG